MAKNRNLAAKALKGRAQRAEYADSVRHRDAVLNPLRPRDVEITARHAGMRGTVKDYVIHQSIIATHW